MPSAAGKGVKRQHELMRLRRELSNAVEREDYEAAAQLRDQISAMEASS